MEESVIMSKNKSEKSYNAYKRMYEEWESKGYHMEEMYNFNEYKEKIFEPAKKMGMKNIARTVASSSRSWSYRETGDIINKLEKEIDIADKEARKELRQQIKGMSRKDLFNELIEEDYSNREEIEAILYG